MKNHVKFLLVTLMLVIGASGDAWAYDDWTSTPSSDHQSVEKYWDNISIPADSYVTLDYEIKGTGYMCVYLYYNNRNNYVNGYTFDADSIGTIYIKNTTGKTQDFSLRAYHYNGNDYSKCSAKVTNIKVVSSPSWKGMKMKESEVNVGVNAGMYLYVSPSTQSSNMTWTSSNTNVATINTDGCVTGKAFGTATITAKAPDGTTATCKVNVVKTEKVILKDLLVGTKSDSRYISPEVIPSCVSSSSSSFTWTSSNNDVAHVDSYGSVKGYSTGTATITATAKDGSGVSGSCTVTVVDGYIFSRYNDYYGSERYNFQSYSTGYQWKELYWKSYGSAYFERKEESIDNCDDWGYGTIEPGTQLHLFFNVDNVSDVGLGGYYGAGNDNGLQFDIAVDGEYVYRCGDNSGWYNGFDDGTVIGNYGTTTTVGPGTHELVLNFKQGSGYSEKDFVTLNYPYINAYSTSSYNDVIASYKVKMETVKVSRDGILGAEALKLHSNLTDFNGLKVVGPLDEYDWKTIKEMELTCLDLTEASGVYPETQYDFNSIKAVKMSNNIKDITRNYFPYASYIYIPDGVTTISAKKFKTDQSYTILTLEGCKGITTLADEVFCESNVGGNLSLNSLVHVPRKAFYGCRFLEGVSLPKAKTVGTSAFEKCMTLASASMPIVASIDTSAFASCTALATLTMPKVEAISERAFMSCKSIDKVYAPLLKNIPAYAFCDSKINEVSFAIVDSVKSHAFAATDVKTVSLPKARYIGNRAFSEKYEYRYANGTDWWGNIKYDTKTITVDKYIQSISAPSVEVIGDSAFYHQADIEKFVTPKLKEVGEYAFASSTQGGWSYNENNQWGNWSVVRNKLKSIDLSSVTSIGSNAFYYCENLQNVDLTNAREIGSGAFLKCTSFTSVDIPNIVRVSESAFQGCNKVESLEAPRVTFIGGGAFSGCSAMKTINIVKADTIGSSAFSGCTSIQNINLPKIASLGGSAFYGCSGAKTIDLSDKLTVLGENAFYGCTGVETLTLPASITKIPSNCFAGSNNIKTINCNAPAPPAVGETPFTMQTLYTAKLLVPEPSINLYQSDTFWKHFYYYGTNPDILTDLILSNVTNMGDVRMDKVNLTMNIGSCLTMTGKDAQDFRSILFKASDAGSGMFISGSDRISSDETKMELAMTGLKWYFVTLPYNVSISDIEKSVADAQIAIYSYDGSKRASSGLGKAWTRVNSGTLTAGQGYIIQASKAVTLTLPASFANKDKVFISTDVTTSLSANTSSTAANAGWNFIGNPYLAYYDIAKMNFEAPITVWTGSTYAAYTPADDEYALRPMQPFFVQCPTGVKSLKFSADGRQATATIKHEEAKAKSRILGNANRQVVDIAISADSTIADRTRFVINGIATDDYDMVCDAAKMMSMDESVAQIYTVGRGIQYAINEGPQAEGEVKIGFMAPKDGTYTFKAVRSDIAVMLYDEATGETVNLAEGDYSFETEAGTNEARFRIILGDEASAIATVSGESASGNDVYDLSGRRQDKAGKGINIIRQNGNVNKVLNR